MRGEMNPQSKQKADMTPSNHFKAHISIFGGEKYNLEDYRGSHITLYLKDEQDNYYYRYGIYRYGKHHGQAVDKGLTISMGGLEIAKQIIKAVDQCLSQMERKRGKKTPWKGGKTRKSKTRKSKTRISKTRISKTRISKTRKLKTCKSKTRKSKTRKSN